MPVENTQVRWPPEVAAEWAWLHALCTFFRRLVFWRHGDDKVAVLVCLPLWRWVGCIPFVSLPEGRRKLTDASLLVVSPIHSVGGSYSENLSTRSPLIVPNVLEKSALDTPFSPLATVCQLLLPLFVPPNPF